ncbi:GNAT family N-acetyltransferase [Marininema halotolerans]|uniref:Acetyltransferase (GNAT) family protein n=1 Tax=Marininema halotolerans TaxID=1155944 RepID=A0A1I6SJC2_9BACL|nr:GNAT family N-acetyltransferase [Marininema halotolerans]SFS77065.1 Acetyltransferase (GNAT) family protein [Marininema halotolerans]
MLHFSSATQLTLDAGTTLWNEGFHGYPLTMTTDPIRYVQRYAEENLSPTLSVIAWEENQPIGFVYNGTRIHQGESIAWNGGTGIVPRYRNQGVGQLLMEEVINTYAKQGIQRAFLEVLSENEPAIRLYQGLGYKEIGRLHVLRHPDIQAPIPLPNDPLRCATRQEIGSLSFYQHESPWQCQWMNGIHTEAWIVEDEENQPVGYSLYRMTLDERGKRTSMNLLQTAVHPTHPDPERILLATLYPLLQPGNHSRAALNIPANHPVLPLLKDLGFEHTFEQLAMERLVPSG